MSSDPPKFASLQLDTPEEPELPCGHHDWEGVIKVNGDLYLRCKECDKYASCSCCGSKKRNHENSAFVCGCIWGVKQLFDEPGKCDLHTDIGSGTVSMKLAQGTRAQIGELCFIDHESGNIFTGASLDLKARAGSPGEAPAQSPVGVVTEVGEDGSVIIALHGNLKVELP